MDELHDIHGLIKLPEYSELKTLAMEMESIVQPNRPTGNVSSESDEGEGGDNDFIDSLKNLNVN